MFFFFFFFPAILESCKSELERESSVRAETETKLRDSDQSLKKIQTKSKQLINALSQQLDEQTTLRVGEELASLLDLFGLSSGMHKHRVAAAAAAVATTAAANTTTTTTTATSSTTNTSKTHTSK